MSEAQSVSAVMRSDTGLVRGHNEDFVACYEPEDTTDALVNGWFYIVADGVGGADAGEVASQYASEQAVQHYLTTYVAYAWDERVLAAMQEANTDLRRLASGRNDKRRMATTMVAAAIHDNQVVIGNVGDSRAYLWRMGELEQLTKDQSLVARLVEEGAISADEAATHPHRNIILSSLGSERKPPIDLYERTLAPGDLLVLCSDGLTLHVNDEEIGETVGMMNKADAADSLIQLALARGGKDNISVSIIQFGARPNEAVVVETVPEHALAMEYAISEQMAAEAVMVAATGAALAPAAIQSPTKTLWPMTLALAMVMAGLLLLIWYVVQIGTTV